MSAEHAKDASISFTAHYTGEMWQRMGLSHPALATAKGKWMYLILAPLNWLVLRLFGVSLNKTLTQRQLLINAACRNFIEQHNNALVVEMAAGLSPRSWRLMQTHKQIRCYEIDLPAMSQLKAKRLDQLPGRTPELVSMNLFSDELKQFLAGLDQSRPLLIITEGLINYFSLSEIEHLGSTLAAALEAHTAGLWVTENYPNHPNRWVQAVSKLSFKFVKLITRSNFSLHFDNPRPVAQFFQNMGFDSVEVLQPCGETHKHGGDALWVIQAHTTNTGDKA